MYIQVYNLNDPSKLTFYHEGEMENRIKSNGPRTRRHNSCVEFTFIPNLSSTNSCKFETDDKLQPKCNEFTSDMMSLQIIHVFLYFRRPRASTFFSLDIRTFLQRI